MLNYGLSCVKTGMLSSKRTIVFASKVMRATILGTLCSIPIIIEKFEINLRGEVKEMENVLKPRLKSE